MVSTFQLTRSTELRLTHQKETKATKKTIPQGSPANGIEAILQTFSHSLTLLAQAALSDRPRRACPTTATLHVIKI